MYTKTFLTAVMASMSLAAPLEERQTSNSFVMIATHSGNTNVHLRGVEASQQRFWLGKDTTTYCPASVVDCSHFSKFLLLSSDLYQDLKLIPTSQQRHHRVRATPHRRRPGYERQCPRRTTSIRDPGWPARIHNGTQLIPTRRLTPSTFFLHA
jgi:hypothetical protein